MTATMATKEPDLQATVRSVRFVAALIAGPCLLIDAFVAFTGAWYFDTLDQTMIILPVLVASMSFGGFRFWPEPGVEPVPPPPPVGIWLHVIPRLAALPVGSILAATAWSRAPGLAALAAGLVVAVVVWPWSRRMKHILSGAIPTLLRN